MTPVHENRDSANGTADNRGARPTAWYRLVRALPWLVLLISLLATMQVWQMTREAVRHYQKTLFDSEVREVVSDIERRMKVYEQVLHGAHGLFSASRDIERDEFRIYVEQQNLDQNYPGIQGLGFAQLVPPSQKDRHIAAIRREVKQGNLPGYSIWPEGRRDLYTSVIYREPFNESNRRAFGYDMYSDRDYPREGDSAPGLRRAAMERARDTGLATISGKVRLVTEDPGNAQAGFLMYLPVYLKDMPHGTVTERRANIIGWVYASFRADDLMDKLLDAHSAKLEFKIYDGLEMSPKMMMHDSLRDHDGRRAEEMQRFQRVDVAGRTWTVWVGSRAGLDTQLNTIKPWVIAFSGITLSILLALITKLLSRGRERAMRAAQTMSQDLARSEERARLAINASSQALWDYDLVNGNVYLSENWSRMLGNEPRPTYTSIEALTAQVPDEDQQEVKDVIMAAIKGVDDSSYRIEHRVNKPGGGYLWIASEGHITERDQDGRALRMMGTNRDITERKAIEMALQESEEKFRHLFEDASDPVLLLKHGKFLDCNAATLKLLGYASKVDLTNRSPGELSPLYQPDGRASAEKSAEMDAKALRDGYNQFEWLHLRADGSTIPIDVTLTPITVEGEQILHVLWRDITERKKAEAQIDRLSRAYRLLGKVNSAIVRARDRDELFEAICAVAVASGLFRFVWIGMLDERKLAVLPVAYAGVEEGYTNRLHIRLDDEHTGKGPTANAIRTAAPFYCQDIQSDPIMVPWREEALKRGYASSAVFPLHEAGTVVGTINVYAGDANFFTHDISQLLQELASNLSFVLDVFAGKQRRESAEAEVRKLNVELESRVQERTRELEVVNRELEAFSYSVSHDLRAPLRSIDGFSQILAKKYRAQLDDTGQDYLARVSRASQRMGLLIEDMLCLSKVTRSALHRETVDLSALAGEVVGELHKGNPGRKLQLNVQPGMAVHADPGLMRIVLDNLLGNACKYTGKKPVAEIEIGSCIMDGEPTFFVRDNGEGFNMDYAHKLFGAFQRLHNVEDFEGTGIGLATVQRIIHRHHGKVWAEAEEGKGATFYFTLPQRLRGA